LIILISLFSEIIQLDKVFEGAAGIFDNHPHDHSHSLMMHPVLDNFQDNSTVVATLSGAAPLGLFFSQMFGEGIGNILIVLGNACGNVTTFNIEGSTANRLGSGDHHDKTYEEQRTTIVFNPLPRQKEWDCWHTRCEYWIDIYPTKNFQYGYLTNKPAILAVVVVLIFGFTSLLFLAYGRLVQIRQAKVWDTAQRSDAIALFLFPENVRDRLFKRKTKPKKDKGPKMIPAIPEGPKFRFKTFLHHDESLAKIADLFPNTIVMFADIVELCPRAIPASLL
jgi:hypothetical protein